VYMIKKEVLERDGDTDGDKKLSLMQKNFMFNIQ